MDPVQLTSCTLTLIRNVGSFLGINVDTLTPHMGLCRILQDTHFSWPIGWEPVRIISKSHSFLFGTTTIQSFTFSNSHFFSGQSWHASSLSYIMLYLWLGAKRPSTQSYDCAVGLLVRSQWYSTIEGEEACQLWPEKKWSLEKVLEGVVVVPKRKLWDLEMILTGSQPTVQERCVSCRILQDPICYAQNTEVAHLTSWERNHILYGS